MILENHWYEVKQTQSEGFFKDLDRSRTKETISYFPKIYYRMENGLISIRVQISLGKYQDQLLKLEKKLESGLYCELVEKELKDSYVEYTLLYDMIANRIGIEEVVGRPISYSPLSRLCWNLMQNYLFLTQKMRT